jgi:molybdate transport system permease protein
MQTAAAAIFVTFFVGLAAAKFVADTKSTALKMLIDGILTMPLVLPPTVAGFFLLFLFGVEGPIGKFFLNFFAVRIAFSWGATVIAAVVISFPLMYRSARGALEQIDPVLVYAGRTLGMSEWRIFTRVRLPIAGPGIAGGGVLAFARGLGEFGATAMIAGNIAGKTRTLPLAVYSEVAAGNWDTALDYVIVIVLFSFIVVALINACATGASSPCKRRSPSNCLSRAPQAPSAHANGARSPKRLSRFIAAFKPPQAVSAHVNGAHSLKCFSRFIAAFKLAFTKLRAFHFSGKE